MLIEFSVANYRSFKDKVTFSMLASEDTTHEETHVIKLPNGERYLKTAVIYGANASGKSSFINALSDMSQLVYTSIQKQPDDPISVIPFGLDKTYQNKPTSFDLICYVNGIKYAYGMVLDSTNVLEEYLYYFEGDKQRTIFERTNTTAYNFADEYGKNDKIEVEVLKYFQKFTANNKLYLSVAVMLDYAPVKDVYNWVSSMYPSGSVMAYNLLKDGYFGGKGDLQYARSIISKAIDWVKDIDTGIKDIEIEENSDLFKDDYLNQGKFTSDNLIKLLNNLYSIHETMTVDGTVQTTKFRFYNSESDGTQSFFIMAIAVAERMSHGAIFLKDELSTNLHTMLSTHTVELFYKQNFNSLSQLIFTNHDTNLMNDQLFRRDQIWFTEKDEQTGATELFSLVDFDVPQDTVEVDIEKGYLMGVYGAIPFIKGDSRG